MAFVVPYTYPPSFGGHELSNYYMAKELAALGHEVHILAADRDYLNRRVGNGTRVIDGFWIHRFRSAIPHIGFEFVPGVILHLLTHEYDVIQIINSKRAANYPVAVIGRFKRVPVVLNELAAGQFEPRHALARAVRLFYYPLMLPFLLRLCTKPILVDYPGDARFLGSLGVDSTVIEKGAVMHGASIDEISQFRQWYKLGHRRIILFVGRIHKQKGVEVLIRSFPMVARQFSDVALLILGVDGGALHDCKELAADLSIEQSVFFLGPVTERTKLVALTVSECVVVPSTTDEENFGIVISEAWAHRKPVVASAVGAFKTRIDSGVDGLLVPPNDPERLAEAICLVLRVPDFARSLGEEGHKKAHTWSQVGQEYSTFYQEVVSVARASRT